MKSASCCSSRWVLWLALLLVAVPALRAAAADLKLEAVLVWGTDDKTSPDPRHKPVTPDVAKKLKCLPFKWSNYFEVSRKSFELKEGAVTVVKMSKDCEIKVKHLGGNKVELTLIGKGKPSGKITQPLPNGETLVTGGNAANLTGWFVVLKHAEPVK